MKSQGALEAGAFLDQAPSWSCTFTWTSLRRAEAMMLTSLRHGAAFRALEHQLHSEF